MGTNLRSNLLDFFGEGKMPALEAVIEAGVGDYPSMKDVFFNQEGMDSDIKQYTTISGLRNPEIKYENEPVKFQTIKSGFPKTFSYNTYATGYRVSFEAVRDGKLGLVERATRSFTKGAFEVKEYNLASIFDDGFTVNGYDGVPLFSRLHPLENGDGAFGINAPSANAQLSKTSYKELRNLLQNVVNENGQLVKYNPKYLVVSQGNQDVAKEILGSTHDPYNANNAINTEYNHTTLVPGGYWSYLGSDTAFFMACEKSDNHLMYLQREAFNVDSDYDKKARAYEIMSFEGYAYGYAGWRGVAGNAGA